MAIVPEAHVLLLPETAESTSATASELAENVKPRPLLIQIGLTCDKSETY